MKYKDFFKTIFILKEFWPSLTEKITSTKKLFCADYQCTQYRKAPFKCVLYCLNNKKS